jgi:hypothetical protein
MRVAWRQATYSAFREGLFRRVHQVVINDPLRQGMEGSVKASGVKVRMVRRGVREGDVGKGVVVRNDIVGRGKNIGAAVAVRMACCVLASAVLTVDMAVSIRSS